MTFDEPGRQREAGEIDDAPVCIVSPSKTRAGRSTTAPGSAAGGFWAERPTAAATSSTSDAINGRDGMQPPFDFARGERIVTFCRGPGFHRGNAAPRFRSGQAGETVDYPGP